MLSSRTVLTISRWVVLALLVAAHGLLAGNSQWIRALSPELADGIRSTAFISQIGLLAAWLMFGPGRWFLRVPLVGLGWLAALVAATGQFELVAGRIRRSEPLELNQVLEYVSDNLVARVAFTESLFVLLIAAGFLLLGVRMRLSEGPEPKVGWRFSLRLLLVLMFVVPPGALLSLRLSQWSAGQVVLHREFAIWAVGAGLAGVLLVCVWAWLKRGNPWARVLVAAALAPSTGLLLGYWFHLEGESWWMILWFAIHAVLVSATFFIVRLCGYRLGWRWNAVAADPSDSAGTKAGAEASKSNAPTPFSKSNA